MAMQNTTFHKGLIINPLSDKRCQFFSQGVLVVKGKKIIDLLDEKKALKKYPRMLAGNVQDHGHSVILPGFFDMHFHWVQDDVRQMPKDNLLQWLEKYTFPNEMKFAEKEFASKKAREFFRKLSSVGTLGGACYSSIHEHAVIEAMKEVRGDFLIGNVLMNMNSPAALTQTDDESLELSKRLMKTFRRRYVFTPRFAISTSPKVMKEGSRYADSARCFKQTHLAETKNEIDFVLALYREMPGFEDVRNYTEIYERTGMLGERSLMGHGIHLSDEELKVLRRTKTVLIHCPTSNAPLKQQGLGSGLFDFKRVEKAKIRWALGSDIGGGPFLSMFDVIRSFVDQNKKKSPGDATYVKGLFRATQAGADILAIGDKTGNLSPGKEANFLVVPLTAKKPADNAEGVLEQIIKPQSKSRPSYESLVAMVSHQGRVVFHRLA